MMHFKHPWLISVLLICYGQLANAINSQEIFQDVNQKIYQIRIINLASGNKAAIGSGFQISADGLLVSNYHVVSEYLQEPGKYRVESLDHQNRHQPLQVLAFDIVHDLAILKTPQPAKTFLSLHDQLPKTGETLYSLGNPHDLGMTLVRGTFNGLLKKSFYQRLLFSGSINPGMSGGPTLNSQGKVIGVNVATAGNQLSFLVPAFQLQPLIEQARSKPLLPQQDISDIVEKQLLENQNQLYQTLFAGSWSTQTIGKATSVGAIANFLKCWGDSYNENDLDSLYTHVYTHCNSEEPIYVNHHFRTGTLYFQYEWLETDTMTPYQFFHTYQKSFADKSAANQASKQDVSEFLCRHEFVSHTNKPWKTVFCIRHYKKYPQLLDLVYTTASLGNADHGLLFTLSASGISAANSIKLINQFMERLTWQP